MTAASERTTVDQMKQGAFVVLLCAVLAGGATGAAVAEPGPVESQALATPTADRYEPFHTPPVD